MHNADLFLLTFASIALAVPLVLAWEAGKAWALGVLRKWNRTRLERALGQSYGERK